MCVIPIQPVLTQYVCGYRQGFGFDIVFIDHLQVVTTNNYSATANLHNSQITTSPLRLFQLDVSSPAVPWQRFLIVEILRLHELKSSLHKLQYRPDWVAHIVFKITRRYGPRRNTPFPTVPLSLRVDIVAAGTCLPSRCLEKCLVYSRISRSSHSSGQITSDSD
jgi:hypothetical protein